MLNTKQTDLVMDFVTEENYVVLKPYLYLCQESGKGIRAVFNAILRKWSNIPKDLVEKIFSLMGHTHNITLLLDDIQDNSVLRRGKPAAHKIYGVAQTLNAGTYMISVLWGQCLKCPHPEQTVELIMEATLDVAKGQGMELYWRDNFICPTEEEYILMVKRKTGRIFQIAVDLQKLYAPKELTATDFGTELGIYFQIFDDYQNLTNEKFFELKGYCDDITEGKFSYPIMHAINNYPEEGALIKDILSKRTTDVELKKQCVALLHKCGSLAHTKKKIDQMRTTLYRKTKEFNCDDELERMLQSCIDSMYIEGTE